MEESNKLQKEALEKAKNAAVNKDAVGFLRFLHESKFMDGAKIRLTAKYKGKFDFERIHEILTKGADRFYTTAAEGKKVLSPAAYLWKIIDNMASDIHKDEKKYIHIDEIDSERSLNLSVDPRKTVEIPNVDTEDSRAERLREGIRISRSLLPKIGEENIQKVMAYYIDAVEKGVEDITSKEISEALGLSQASVRVWKQRGFERLERAAIEAGYRKEFFLEISDDNDAEAQDVEDE